MRKLFIAALMLVLVAGYAVAQEAEGIAVSTVTPTRYGIIAYDSLLRAMPEYATAQSALKQLREKYDNEVNYNEADFKRQFTEFLQGQKDFPQSIMLKRQRDLQEAMEKSLAFRHEADSLVAAAAVDLERPVRQLLDEAIRQVGRERGYHCIVNSELNTLPYISEALAEDAVPYVTAKLTALRRARR